LSTLALIGGGIAGRSLLYNLTAYHLPFDKILLFESAPFAPPCSLYSTAIVAPRGVTRGNSTLGDLIIDGFDCFSAHARDASPAGVHCIIQYTGCITKLDHFKLRYPHGSVVPAVGKIQLDEQIYFTSDEALMIDPPVYLNWLMQESQSKLPLFKIDDFVTGIENAQKVKISTQSGQLYEADKVVFATGAASRFWKNLVSDNKLDSSKPVQGAYLVFEDLHWDLPSFSITLEGYNLIYNEKTCKALIGSSSENHIHCLPSLKELKAIFHFLKKVIVLDFPEFSEGKILVGHREKARKREPYMFTEGNVSFIGGLYKNGFTLSLEMTKNLAHQLLGSV
jgi:glycine/D-amino acid oxidase-like deaminating enzyme